MINKRKKIKEKECELESDGVIWGGRGEEEDLSERFRRFERSKNCFFFHTLSAASSKRFMFISLIAENERVGVALRIDFVNMDSIFQK